MLHRERPLTWEDLAAMPEDNLRREIIGGELIVTPAPDYWHQRLVVRVWLMLETAGQGKGEASVSPLEIRLSEHDAVQPDVLFLSSEKREQLGPEGKIYGAPDIVVEIVSPTSSSNDRVRKFALYARSGVPEYWIIDRRSLAIDILVLEDGHYARVEPEPGGAYRSRVLPNLAVHPDTLFADLG